MEKWVLVGERLGYEGKELRDFVFSEQEKEREERIVERDETKRKEEENREENRRKEERKIQENREIREFELRKLELDRREHVHVPDHNVRARVPKLPEYKDNVDSMDAYLNVLRDLQPHKIGIVIHGQLV